MSIKVEKRNEATSDATLTCEKCAATHTFVGISSETPQALDRDKSSPPEKIVLRDFKTVAAAARYLASGEGWSSSNGKDGCPSHRV